MHPLDGLRRRLTSSISAALLFLIPALVGAAQVQTLPSQQNFHLPSSIPMPLSHQGADTFPPIPKLPGSQGNTRELPLPEVFRGCWSGDVPRLDSMVRLDRRGAGIIWLTKSYTLCYKQTGLNGKWKLTFAEGSVANKREVSDERQSISVKSVRSADEAELTAFLHFRAPAVNMFGLPTNIVNTVDELTHLHCKVRPERGVMNVQAAVFVENNDVPSVNVTWHAQFARMAGAKIEGRADTE